MLCSKCFQNDIVDVIGLCDPDKINIDGNNTDELNWTEISIPELLQIPVQKPDVEHIDKVFIDVNIRSQKVIKTPEPTGENEEGTELTGRKLVIQGELIQKVVYTANVCVQSVHSAKYRVPFCAYIVVPKDIIITPGDPPITEDALNVPFCVETCIEDVFVKTLNCREFFKNVTLFLRAKPIVD